MAGNFEMAARAFGIRGVLSAQEAAGQGIKITIIMKDPL
jgi:hypothetical protein